MSISKELEGSGMALIGRVELGPVFLQETLATVPEMSLQYEEFRQVSGNPQLIVWAFGDDFEAFENALATDPTVTEYRLHSEIQERRLYRISFPAEERERFLYPVVRDEEILTLESTITADGIRLVARFPSREEVATLKAACNELRISFQLEQLYYEGSIAGDGGPEGRFGVTDAQREALLHALEAGYFAVPRQAELKEIAAEINISSSALSTRLRRGQQNLLQNTLAVEAST